MMERGIAIFLFLQPFNKKAYVIDLDNDNILYQTQLARGVGKDGINFLIRDCRTKYQINKVIFCGNKNYCTHYVPSQVNKYNDIEIEFREDK